MDLGLRGRKALVTGASKGIGQACAEALAEEGCDVVLVSRTAADLDKVRAKIAGEHNVAVRYYAPHLSDSKNVDQPAAACADSGLRVVGINPGPVMTERLITLTRHRAQTQLGDPERWQELMKGYAFGRAAKPEEIGWMAAFLASDRSGYTTGTIVTIDGGGGSRRSAL